jgi:hypothetical protein
MPSAVSPTPIPICQNLGNPSHFVAMLRREVSQSAAYTSPSTVTELHLTFWHDTSGRGFPVRKFGRGQNPLLPWLCPVDAALSLLRRAFALKPFIIAMLHTLGARVSTGIAVDAQHILDLHALLFDAISLGIFTGSQVGEYATSKEAQNVLSRVPASHSNPVERGKPNTFVAGDFVVYDKLRRAVSPQTAYLSPLAVTELHLTFQHDKSDRCFTLRKFGRNHNQSLPGLYPVYAALSLLRCATALGIPPNDPICAFWLIKGGSHPHFLCNSDVTCYERSLSG